MVIRKSLSKCHSVTSPLFFVPIRIPVLQTTIRPSDSQALNVTTPSAFISDGATTYNTHHRQPSPCVNIGTSNRLTTLRLGLTRDATPGLALTGNPLFEGIVHATLPTGSAGFEEGQHFRAVADAD